MTDTEHETVEGVDSRDVDYYLWAALNILTDAGGPVAAIAYLRSARERLPVLERSIRDSIADEIEAVAARRGNAAGAFYEAARIARGCSCPASSLFNGPSADCPSHGYPVADRTTEREIRDCFEAGHDVGMRHEDGSLYSATCHDCGKRYVRGDEPATPNPDGER